MHGLARRHVLTVAFAGLAGGLACGEDGGSGGDGGGAFSEPADFDRGDCRAGAAVDAVDVAGIWHADVAFDGLLPRPAAIRIDPTAGGNGFSAYLFGGRTDDVRLTPDDLFIRYEAVVDGDEVVVAVDLCRMQDDGSLAGLVARCIAGNCGLGRIAAYPVPPLDDAEAENMTLVGEWEGPASDPWPQAYTLNVRHHGTAAYLVHDNDGLRIIDLADPAHPADLGHLAPAFPASEYYNDVKVVETADGAVYALLASNGRGVVVADVTDPTAPVEVTSFPAPPVSGGGVNVHTLFVEGDRVYLANLDVGGIEIYDIADPTRPVPLGAYVYPDAGALGGFVHDLFVQDGVAYLNYWSVGFVVVDAADPAHPALLGVFDDYPRRTSHSNWVTEAGGRRIAIHGDEDFDAHVRIIDVDPDSPTVFTEIGSYQTRPQVSVHNIMATGGLALVTYYQDGLRVLDLADPTSPVEIAHFATWPGAASGYGGSFYEAAIGVDYDAERDLILVADTHRGLLVLTLDR